MDPARTNPNLSSSLFETTLGTSLQFPSLPDRSSSPALPPARRRTFVAATMYRSSSRALMPPPLVTGNAMGRTTPITSNLTSGATPAHSSIESLSSSFVEPLSSVLESPQSSAIWHRGKKSHAASVEDVVGEESLQDVIEFIPSQTPSGNDSHSLQNEELDVRSGRRVKRTKQDDDYTSDGYDFLPKQETASPVIRSISTHAESDNTPYTGPARNPAHIVRSTTQTNRLDKPGRSNDMSVTADPTQIRQHNEQRKYWASCSMDNWMQDGEELHNAFAQIFERLKLGLVDDMTSIQSMQTLLDAHRQFLAQRDSVLVDVKKVKLGGRGLWADNGAVL